MELKVTALVSVYRADAFLAGCLADLFAQTLFARGGVEVLVIDSGSPGREGEIVRDSVRGWTAVSEGKWRHASGSLLTYIRTERETLYAAWSRGAEMAHGDYLTTANADDRHDPRCLELLAAALDAHPDVALVYPDSLTTSDANAAFGDAKVDGRLRVREGDEGWPAFDRDVLFETCYAGPHPMWRRSLHEKHGYFDATMKSAGDYEFWLRLAARGEKFLRVAPGGEALSLYLQNMQSISLSNANLSWHESEVARNRYWQKAWGMPAWLRGVAPKFEALRERVPAGVKRVAIYGAGKHTVRHLSLFREAAQPAAVVAILDDAPKGAMLEGVPIVETARWRETSCDVIVLSSDRFEQQMAERLRGLVTCPILGLYTEREVAPCR